MWKPVIIAGALLLAGCAGTSTPSPADIAFAASASLDQAEVLALAYAKSPVADPAVVAKIKALDNTAYNAIHPLVDTAKSGGSVVTAAEAEAAQAALGALTSYLVSNGVK